MRLTLVVLAFVLLTPADAFAVGELKQKTGVAGCVTGDGSGGQCRDGNEIGATDVALSPNGKTLYSVSFDRHTIAVFDRTTAGELTQKPGPAGCLSDTGLTGCQDVVAMNKPTGIAVSPDGESVYVGSYDTQAIAIFDRDTATGELTQKPGLDGCISQSGSGGACRTGHGMGRVDRVIVSGDGLNVYAAGSDGGNSVIAFDRDPSTGEIEQKPGTAGCLSDDGSGGQCQDGKALFHVEGLAISPDGRSLYATSRFTDAVAIIDRDPSDGSIAQKAGTAGCVSETGSGGECADGVALDSGSPHLKSPVVSPDGENLYVPASDSDAVAIFDRAANGTLTQTGCISEDATGGLCQDGRGLAGAWDSDASADGRSVYIGGIAGVAVLDRDPATGALAQKAGTAGCVSDAGGECTDAFGNGGLGGVPAVSPDGKSFYTGMVGGLAVFDRTIPPPPDPGPGPGPVDGDLDTVPDVSDNCPNVANPDQADADGDRIGNACDGDDDNDGVADGADACPLQFATGADGCPPLRVEGVTPNAGGPSVVTMTLRGTGLTGSPQVRLRLSGRPDIAAGHVFTTPGGRALDARFDLAGKRVGTYDVVVLRGGGATVLRDAFTVQRTAQARVVAEVLGRAGALGNYPVNLLLRIANRGNVDAVNPTVIVRGFHTGADVDVIGAGVATAQLDDGTGHAVAVTADRVPAKGAETALLRFTPVGPAHARYRLTTEALADTIPAREVRPATNASASITRAPSAQTDTSESGVMNVVSSSGSTGVAYSLAFRPGGSRVRPAVTRGGSGYELRASVPAAGEAPPANAAPSTGRMELELRGSAAALERLRTVRDGTGNNAVTAQRKQIADCLLARKYIDRGQHDELDGLADGSALVTAVQLGLGDAASEIVTGRFPTFAALFGGAWEDRLIAFVKEAAAKDPGNPFFKNKTAEEINGAALELCRRDDPKPAPDEPKPPPPPKKDEPPVDPPPIPRPPPPPPFDLEVFYPADPNDKVGPAGYGRRHHVQPDVPLPYVVLFENKPDATAPAHEVRITDQLDARRLDLSTLELGPVFFGADRVLSPPPGLQSWSDSIDLRPEQNLIVRVDAGLDRATGVLSWHLQGLDPATGELDTIPENGFLPPDRTPPQGQGGVTFTVAPRAGLKTGDRIANGASIVFDRNAPIVTPTFVNTIDRTPPRSRVASVRARSCRTMRVRFAGRDRGAGIAFRTVSVSRNGAKYRVWRARERRRAARYRAVREGAYAFRSVAVDGVGHAEAGTRLWDALVTRARKRGNRLVLSLSRSGARRLGVRSLRVLVDGRRKAAVKRVRGSVVLRGVKPGGHTIRLDAKARRGKRTVRIRDARAVAMCARRR